MQMLQKRPVVSAGRTGGRAAIFLAESFALADIHALRKKPFPQQVVRCERKPAKAES